MKKTRYVEIPADRLLDRLDAIGNLSVAKKGATHSRSVVGREIVWTLTLPGELSQIRVYTSIGHGDAVARECGKDAVRVVVGAVVDGTFRPLEKGQKILRTAPKDAEDRPGVFLDRLADQLRAAWKRARRVRPCPGCGRPMAARTGPRGSFLGCTGYPACRVTINV